MNRHQQIAGIRAQTVCLDIFAGEIRVLAHIGSRGLPLATRLLPCRDLYPSFLVAARLFRGIDTRAMLDTFIWRKLARCLCAPCVLLARFPRTERARGNAIEVQDQPPVLTPGPVAVDVESL